MLLLLLKDMVIAVLDNNYSKYLTTYVCSLYVYVFALSLMFVLNIINEHLLKYEI